MSAVIGDAASGRRGFLVLNIPNIVGLSADRKRKQGAVQKNFIFFSLPWPVAGIRVECFFEIRERRYTIAMTTTPVVRGIVETCVNVSDMERARRFYDGLFGFEVMEHDERFCAYRVGADVLLLFTQGSLNNPIHVSGGMIPPHDTVGAGHFAFGVSKTELETWPKLLGEHGIEIESEVRWERGGNSIYFRDPDGNLVELVSPGTWANY